MSRYGRDEWNRDVGSEIDFYLDMRTQELEREGHPPREARKLAERAFGDRRRWEAQCRRVAQPVEAAEERSLPVRWAMRLGRLGQDFRYAWRALSRTPGFALAAVLTLALGAGVNTAIFSVTDAVLFSPLPYPQPEQLVSIHPVSPSGSVNLWFDLETGLRWTREADFVDRIGFHASQNMILSGDGGEPVMKRVARVSDGFFPALRVSPRLGRWILPEDAVPGSETAVVISYPLWRERFGGRGDILGLRIQIDEQDCTVAGVMPSGFRFPYLQRIDIWTAYRDGQSLLGAPPERIQLMARLPQGMSLQEAQQRSEAFERALRGPDGSESESDDAARVRLSPVGRNRTNSDVRQALWLVTGASALILLIGLFNVMNLMAVRHTARRRELGVRMALGASRGRLLQMLMAESLMISLAAGTLGVALAWAGARFLLSQVPNEVRLGPPLESTVGSRAVLYAALLSLAAGVILGLAAALRSWAASRSAGISLMRSRGRASRGGGRLRSGLVVAEVALSASLLLGAGLLLKTFVGLVSSDLGFDSQQLVFFQPGLAEKRYPDPAESTRYFREVEARAGSLPGVESATLTDGMPGTIMFSSEMESDLGPAGLEDYAIIAVHGVEADFLQVMGIPLLSGRPPGEDASDDEAVIGRDLARMLWGEGDPLGRSFRLSPRHRWYRVIGVIPELKIFALNEAHPTFEILTRAPRPRLGLYDTLVIRASQDPEKLLQPIRRAAFEVDPLQPVWQLRTASQALGEVMAKPRFFLLLMMAFAAVAVLLAMLGVYSVLAYTVRLRRREMGVRLAVGASPAAVLRLVLKSGASLVLLGTAAGVLAGLQFTNLLSSILAQTPSADPSILAAVAALMLIVALAACFFPARRASRLDPVEVLGQD